MKKEEYKILIDTNNIYREHKGDVLLSSFVVWVCVFAVLLFPLFGFGLAFFLMSVLCIGFKKIVLNTIRGNTFKVEDVFDYYKSSLSSLCLRICSLVSIILWSLLLVIPGIICGLNFCLAPYIFADEPNIGTFECLKKSKQLTYGSRAELLVIFLLETLFVVLTATLSSCFVIILNFIVAMPLWFNIVVPMLITIFCFFVLILPYFEILIGNYYVNLLKANTTKVTTSKKSNKNVSTKR